MLDESGLPVAFWGEAFGALVHGSADSGTGGRHSEMVRMLSDMVISVEGRKNEGMAGTRQWINGL